MTRSAVLWPAVFLCSMAHAWTGAPSPHDGHHLVVLRAADFGAADGGKRHQESFAVVGN